MECPVCAKTDIIKIFEEEHVKFICKCGHTWSEKYSDQGGKHSRPASYKIQLEDLFFQEEEKIYNKIIKELEQNKSFYLNAEPQEQAKALLNNCQIDKIKFFEIIKRINDFHHKLDFKF